MAGVAFREFAYQDPKPAARHFNVAQAGRDRIPLCGATSADGSGFAKGRFSYTTDAARVTCKRCLKKFEKQADEIVRAFLKQHPELAEV